VYICTEVVRFISAYCHIIIGKIIDQGTIEVYNPSHGKSDLIKGPTKEIHNGSI